MPGRGPADIVIGYFTRGSASIKGVHRAEGEEVFRTPKRESEHRRRHLRIDDPSPVPHAINISVVRIGHVHFHYACIKSGGPICNVAAFGTGIA
ncbi:hypothetical protein D3C77_699100 [compost metagenome]